MIKACSLNIDAYNREIDNRGNPMFPCGGYTTVVSSVHEIPWHWHKEVEVFVVRNGALTLQFVGGEHRVARGEGAFINTEVLHAATALEGEDCEMLSLVFHPDLIAGMAEGSIEQRYVRPLLESCELPCVCFGASVPWHQEAVQFILEAFEAYRSAQFGYEIEVREALSRLWLRMVVNHRQSINQQTAPSQDAFRLKTMLGYIHAHYAERIALADLAKTASISERECLRCFKRTTGVTPMQYLLKHRLSVAAGQIESTDLSITDICSQCGFESPSYFSLAFKKQMEMTPREYRKFMTGCAG